MGQAAPLIMTKMLNYKSIIIFISLFTSCWLSARPIKVACVGNSVTYGLGIENPADNYPSQLQRMLGEGYQVKNLGHSGATLLKRGHNPYWKLPEFREAIAFKPDVVIIHLGLNDTDPRNWPKYRDQFVSDYSSLIDTFKAVNPAVDVKICRLTPIFSGHPRFKSSTRDWYWQVQDAIETVAKINHVTLIDLQAPLYRRPDLFPDALHPSSEGATIIAETVYGAITRDYGGLKPAPVFTNGMVLQRRKPIIFWGTANGGSTVTVRFNKQQKTTGVDNTGHWKVEFPPLEAGGPYTASLESGTDKIILDDILIGDIWVCSGQSNMEFRLAQSATGSEDIPAADFPQIRLFNMQPVAYTTPGAWSEEVLKKINRLEYFAPATWQHCTPESAANFSAVAYHFGKTLHEQTGIPIGLILNAVGGSPAESWIDRKRLEHHPRLVDMFNNWGKNDYIHPWCRERAAQNIQHSTNPLQRHPYHPAYLYEAAIEKITRLPVTGVIWYQGESNEQNVELHEEIFPTLVKSWREAWNSKLPFYYVQLSSMAVGRETWGHFRDSQRRLMLHIPNSGMAVSSDLGDSTDVHPRQKRQVGERLARWALHQSYGKTDLIPSGPLFRNLSVSDGAVWVSFDYADGLHTSDGKPPRSFELAEYPGLFHPATATISGNRVRLSSTAVKQPRYVRYGWSSYSNGNLVNREGLPASTFAGKLYHTSTETVSSDKLAAGLMLLPKPQLITLHTGSRHPLSGGRLNENRVKVQMVDEIPEATVNPEEAYRLRVTADTILIEAATDRGIYWAQQTLAQLVESSDGKSLPSLEITDWPAFRVRGFLHDVGRSYMSVDEIKKHIRLLSKFKINVFHWHLTENQGWRLESRLFPQLNDSIHYERHHARYYTIAEAHEIAEYCRQHNMLLIPEIDIPGHSAAFVRAIGHDMQSPEGMKVLKQLMEEICTEVFPDAPWIHIGTDEVEFTNPGFVPEMVAHIRGMGKKVISWNPGWNYKPGEIDATQLWSYRGKAQPGIPAIDCRFHYINHFDTFGDIVALYNSRIGNVDQGSDDMAGGIVAIWNDRLLPDDRQIILQNNFYPVMLAFAERAWCGGGTEYFDGNGTILPCNLNDPLFYSFVDFENRLLWHKKRTFAGEPFPYVRQTHLKWRITDPFPNGGDLLKSFPPEEEIAATYQYAGSEYGSKDAVGAGIYLRHVWGKTLPAFYNDPQENHTAYAYTWVWSPRTETVGLWVSTQDYSRSESDLAPPRGKWDYRESRVFINNREIAPPVWENTHSQRTNEITLKNENFQARPPIPVKLRKGWNSVLLKLPVGKFSSPEVRLQKWMFTFIFVTPDGGDAAEGLIYSPDRTK